MAAGKGNGLKLRITGPDGRVQEARADSDSIILGSGAGAAVRIQDPGVSNMHVMLKVANGSVMAIDLGSETGTKVRDQRVNVPVALASGDVLYVGGSRVEVLWGEEPAHVVQAPAGAMAPTRLQNSTISPVAGVAPVIPEIVTPASAPSMPLIDGFRELRQREAPPKLERRRTVPVPAERLHTLPPQAQAQAYVPPRRQRVAAHLQDPLPVDAQPTVRERVLQVGLHWGDQMMGVSHFADGTDVLVGEGRKNHFHVFAPEVGQSFVLARSHKDHLEVRAPRGAGVIVTSDGHVRSKDSLRAAGALKTEGDAEVYTLGLHDRIEVAVENVAFVARYVKPSAAIVTTGNGKKDYTLFTVTVASLMLLAAFIATVQLMPKAPPPSAEDIAAANKAVAKFLVVKEKPPPPLKKKQLSGVEEGAKAEKEEGKFGDEKAKQAEAARSKDGAPIVQKDKKEEDRKKVANVGMLAAFNALNKNGSAVSNVFGPGGFGKGLNDALGGLKGGPGVGTAQGVGGLGSRGTGTGGGGTGLGLGGLGTKGDGRGAGGSGGIDLGGRGKEITKIIPGKTIIVGGLSKDVIEKVIRRHQSEIKYCYESELNKNKDLKGKVAVAFNIDATGVVNAANVSENTLGSDAAANCMLARIRRWKFPEAQGGGETAVTYPWLFAPAGQ